MRRNDDIFQGQQGMSHWYRFLRKNIQTGAPNATLLQCLDEFFLVDDPAAAGRNDKRTRLHHGKLFLTNESFGLRSQWNMETYKIALRQAGQQVCHRFDIILAQVFCRNIWIINSHSHSQGGSSGSESPSNSTKADQQQGFSEQVNPGHPGPETPIP